MHAGLLVLVAFVASAASASPPARPREGEPLPEGIEVSVPKGASPKRSPRDAVQLACKGGQYEQGAGELSQVASVDFFPAETDEEIPVEWRTPAVWLVCGEGTIVGGGSPSPGLRCSARCKRGCLIFSDDTGKLQASGRLGNAPASDCEDLCD